MNLLKRLIGKTNLVLQLSGLPNTPPVIYRFSVLSLTYMANISHLPFQGQNLFNNGILNLFAPLSMVRFKREKIQKKLNWVCLVLFFSQIQFGGDKTKGAYKCSFHYFPSWGVEWKLPSFSENMRSWGMRLGHNPGNVH